MIRHADAIPRLPKANVLLFGFLLNFPWEFIQAPLFDGMAGAPHWEAVKSCTSAALGDAVIMQGCSTLQLLTQVQQRLL